MLGNHACSLSDLRYDGQISGRCSSVHSEDSSVHTVAAKLEWVWPDKDSNSTVITVDKCTGVVTILKFRHARANPMERYSGLAGTPKRACTCVNAPIQCIS